MKKIGILGGLGPESTAGFYTQLTRRYYELKGDYNYPEIVMISLPMGPFIADGYRRPDEVAAAIERLAGAGADLAVAACNSVHMVYREVSPRLSIPWISIMEATAEKILESAIRRVALLGTRFTMKADFYSRAFERDGIEILTPPADSREEINDIIYGELVLSHVSDDSRRKVRGIIEELAGRGAEGVVLACTELPFLIGPEDAPVAVFDTTAILAEKALAVAMTG